MGMYWADSGVPLQGSGFRVSGSWLRLRGLGFTVPGLRVLSEA